jgi:hypothetical protein
MGWTADSKYFAIFNVADNNGVLVDVSPFQVVLRMPRPFAPTPIPGWLADLQESREWLSYAGESGGRMTFSATPQLWSRDGLRVVEPGSKRPVIRDLRPGPRL